MFREYLTNFSNVRFYPCLTIMSNVYLHVINEICRGSTYLIDYVRVTLRPRKQQNELTGLEEQSGNCIRCYNLEIYDTLTKVIR